MEFNKYMNEVLRVYKSVGIYCFKKWTNFLFPQDNWVNNFPAVQFMKSKNIILLKFLLEPRYDKSANFVLHTGLYFVATREPLFS